MTAAAKKKPVIVEAVPPAVVDDDPRAKLLAAIHADFAARNAVEQ